MQITENQKNLLAYLGPEYSVKIIDGVESIYRKINENYDIEVSGTLRKGHNMSIFVWDISGGIPTEIVERHFDIKDWAQLKSLLNQIVEKYSD